MSMNLRADNTFVQDNGWYAAAGRYDDFVRRYQQANEAAGMKQYLVPYFMSSHPGCTLDDAIALAVYMKRTGQHPDQVQDFYPTPGTLSTCMYYTGIDPRTPETCGRYTFPEILRKRPCSGR